MRKLDTDRVVALSAMVVGVASLVVVVFQTRIMRQQQLASALPYLMIAMHANENGTAVVLSNNGVGPALVRDVRVQQGGRDVPGDPYDFYTRLHPDSGQISVDKIIPGRLIPAGGSVEMLGVPARSARHLRFLGEVLHLFEFAEVPRSWYTGAGATERDKAVIVISYESVYGERWRVRSDRMVPERIP